MCEASTWRDPDSIDTLAAAEAEAGKWDDATKHEKLAIDSAWDDPDAAKDYAARLASYAQKKPWRQIKVLGAASE
jgi:hypothetical protein